MGTLNGWNRKGWGHSMGGIGRDGKRGVGMGTLKGWNREGGEERCRDGDTAEGMEQEGIGRELEV